MRQKCIKNVKHIKCCCGVILKGKLFRSIATCLAALGFLYPCSALAANDLLANLMPLLKATFGPGSVTVRAFYLLVIGVGVWRYHVTGNLAPVASIVIVVLVVTFGMSHLVFN